MNLCECPVEAEGEEHADRILKAVQEGILLGETLYYKRGQVIFYEGHSPYGFFLIKRGRLAPPYGQTEVLGLRHVVSDSPYCASAVAQTNVELRFFSKSRIKNMSL